MNIFLDNEDYVLFLRRLKENIYPTNMPVPVTKHGYIRKSLAPNMFDLLCYCLMPNHFHLLVRQNADLSVSKLITKICTSYSKCFNSKYARVGSLFQDQFKAVLVESNEQLLWLSAYIHKNPLKGKIVTHLEDYIYSSYLEYVGESQLVLCKTDAVLGQCGYSCDFYKKYIMDTHNEQNNPSLNID